MPEPEVRRRRRPAVSCTLCRRRKIRCNREQPCSNCLRARKNVACVYEELPPLATGGSATGPRTGTDAGAEDVTTRPPTTSPATSTVPASGPKLARRPNNEGIVFRNGPHSHSQTQNSQTTTPAASSIESLDPARPSVGTTFHSAIFGLTGLTVADISPSGGQPLSSTTANANSASASGNNSAPTTGPTSAVPSPFDHQNVMGLPEFNYDNSTTQTQAKGRLHAKSDNNTHTSPDVQSMHQRIRHLEAQLHDERRERQSGSHRERHRDRRSHGRDRDHRGDRHGPNLPHMVVSESADNAPMSYLTIEDPPPLSSWSHNSRHSRRSRRSYRSHRSHGRHRSSRWSRSRSRSRSNSHSRSRSPSRQRHSRSYRYASRRSLSPRSRSQTPRSTRGRSRSPRRGYRHSSRSRSRWRSQSLDSYRDSRSPSPHHRRHGRHHSRSHPHSHYDPHGSHSHGGSTTLTPNNPLSDRGKHHLCFSNNEFENANNENADENGNDVTTTNALALADRPPTPSVVNWPTKPSSIAGDFFVSSRGRSFGPREREHDRPRSYRMHMTSRSVMHKTRLFGQSHWVNSIVGFRDIFEMIDPLVTEVSDSTASKVFVDMQRLKHMGRIIKALRVGPAWPPSSVGGAQSGQGGPESYSLPARELADELVECYLRSTESVYRILHIPMFRREYEALWKAVDTNTPLSKADMAFLTQLKLVLAIGSATHRDHIALRARAVRWFYAAQAWFAEPEYKAHLTMQVLQIHLLLLFAREATGIGGALIWISVGDLVRSAVYMGLHRDPDRLPKRMSRLAAEMRRRLWNTILELVVSSSLDAGGPAMLSMTDFDARPPSNIDDEALEESMLAETAAAKAAAAKTQQQPASATPGDPPPTRMNGLESAGIVATQAQPNALPSNCAKNIYIDNGNMRGVPEPATAAEFLAQEKRSDGEWVNGGVGVNRDDPLGRRGIDDRDRDRRDGWQKKVYVEERNTPRAPPPQVCIALRQARDETPQGRPVNDESDEEDGGKSDEDRVRAVPDPSSDSSRPSHKFTSMSVAVALRKTLPVRLTICKFLNDMGPPGTYADTLRLDRQFRSAYRELFDTLQGYRQASASTSEENTLDHCTVAMIQLNMRRYLLCLHIPFFGASMHEETAYAYSRRVVSETAVRVWHTCCPGIVDTSIPTDEAADVAAGEARSPGVRSGRMFVDPALARQTMLGAGALRRLAMQASLLVAAEAKFQLVEDTDVADPAGGRIRPDLLAIIESSAHWCLRSIEAGETNFKGYLLWRLIERQLDGMRRGMMAAPTATPESRLELARELVAGAEEAEKLCMPILEGMMARGIEAAASSPEGGVGPGTEVHYLIRMCRIEDCPCQTLYRQYLQQQQQQQQQQQEQQQQQALEAAQLAEQQQQIQNMSTQPPFMPGIQQPLDPMAIDFTVDNWEFIMPDAQSLNIGSGEPLSWLFNGEPTQGIIW